jgi:catechol 2,3-dioxygenase-like lactoylglutathione lyase family enzyme
MKVLGIEQVTFGVENLDECKRFWNDWGLKLVDESSSGSAFETLNGGKVIVRAIDDPSLPPAMEPGSTLREAYWGVDTQASLDEIEERIKELPSFVKEEGSVGCTDPNGFSFRFRITTARDTGIVGDQFNSWGNSPRKNTPAAIYERATPMEIGHIVHFTDRIAEMEEFYHTNFGFEASDRYPGRGLFMRCNVEGGHHDMFLLQVPGKERGLNHVAFTVRDINEVFGGGLNMSSRGWETEIGPGRHPISSAYFWYFKNPCGALVEYYSNEDSLDGNWVPREHESTPANFAEWAIAGGLDAKTRRQKR